MDVLIELFLLRRSDPFRCSGLCINNVVGRGLLRVRGENCLIKS
jgi:hypothetical protein